MFNWLWGKLVYAFQFTISSLYAILNQFTTWASSEIQQCWDYAGSTQTGIFGVCISRLSTVYDYLNHDLVNNQGVRTAIQSVTYFIPVHHLLTIVTGGFTVMGTIRLARWIKSFVPTIGD